jgi:hypothetical protein
MDSFSIPPHPEEINAQNILVRLVDSIKFRFQLSVLDLTIADYDFKINPTGKSLGELLTHIYKLQTTTLTALHAEHLYPPNAPIESVADDTILILNSIRLKLLNIKEVADFDKVSLQGLSFWNLINGPLTDTLTHIGQVNIIKRALNKPTRKSSMIKGIFKKEESI